MAANIYCGCSTYVVKKLMLSLNEGQLMAVEEMGFGELKK